MDDQNTQISKLLRASETGHKPLETYAAAAQFLNRIDRQDYPVRLLHVYLILARTANQMEDHDNAGSYYGRILAKTSLMNGLESLKRETIIALAKIYVDAGSGPCIGLLFAQIIRKPLLRAAIDNATLNEIESIVCRLSSHTAAAFRIAITGSCDRNNDGT